jgi:hypothetical protein
LKHDCNKKAEAGVLAAVKLEGWKAGRLKGLMAEMFF